MTAALTPALPNEMFLPVFEEVLDWQLNVLRRYPQATLTVLVIEPKLSGLVDEALEDAVRAFRIDLCRTIRASDLVAQGLGNEVWLLLPHSDGAGALARLRDVFGNTETPVYRSATLDVQYGTVLPDNAAHLMGDLRCQLS
jgi:hypothetical protein